jgi:hypothetical protein
MARTPSGRITGVYPPALRGSQDTAFASLVYFSINSMGELLNRSQALKTRGSKKNKKSPCGALPLDIYPIVYH